MEYGIVFIYHERKTMPFNICFFCRSICNRFQFDIFQLDLLYRTQNTVYNVQSDLRVAYK